MKHRTGGGCGEAPGHLPHVLQRCQGPTRLIFGPLFLPERVFWPFLFRVAKTTKNTA